jgi:hypothetical protein
METTIGLSRLLSSGSGAVSKGTSSPENMTPGFKLAEDIVKRQRRLEKARFNQDNIWDDVDRFVTSRRSHYNVGYIRGDSPNDEGGSDIYDDAAADAIQKFSDNFQAQTASPLIDWWMSRFRGPLRENQDAMKWMDEAKEAATYEMNRSPFFEEYNEAVQDAVSHGVATMAGPEWNYEKSVLDYQSFHPREIFMWFDVHGRPLGWHHKFPLTGRQILSEFPDARLTEVFKKKIDENPFREFMCIHAIFKRSERDVKSIAATDKAWASVWVVETEKIVLKESGYDDDGVDMPMDTWVWRKGSNGLYCFCPATDSIYSVIMENNAAKSLLKAMQLSVEPPLIITEGVKGNVNFFPLGQTILHNANDKVAAFQFPTNFAVSVEQVNDLRKQLGTRFRADLFTMMADLPASTKAFTAAGVQGEKASGLIPIITRSSSQTLMPKLNKTMNILARQGRLPTPPQSIMQYAKSLVDLEMMGPVATAAKRYLGQQGFNAMLAQLGEIENVTKGAPALFQAIIEGFNPDEWRKFMVTSNSAPQKLLLDEKQLAMIRQQKADMLKQKQQDERMMMMAKAAHDGGQKPEQGSPTAQQMGQ